MAADCQRARRLARLVMGEGLQVVDPLGDGGTGEVLGQHAPKPDTILAEVMDADETQCRLWEIAENLHRAELSALERDEHVAEWIRLTGEKLRQPDAVSGGRGNGRGRNCHMLWQFPAGAETKAAFVLHPAN